MVRKHSPARSPQSCLSGNFSPFSAEMVQNDFSSICTVERHQRALSNEEMTRFEDMSRSSRWTFRTSLKPTFRKQVMAVSASIDLNILIYAVKTSFHTVLSEHKIFEHFFVRNSVLGTPCGWNGFQMKCRFETIRKNDRGRASQFL